MKNSYGPLLLFLLLFFPILLQGQSCGCDGTVPTHNVDLTGDPDTSWTTSDSREGHCCGATGSTRCIKFDVSLHPEATQIGFDVANPSPPGGAFYQVNCGPQIPLDSNLCIVDISSPFCITYCKSGNDNADYTISTSRDFGNSGNLSVRQGCSDSLWVSGYEEESLSWTSVYPGAEGDHDGYLSCADSCDTTLVTPALGAPDTILYEVEGYLSGCEGSLFQDTISVHTFPGMTLDVLPDTAYVCVGESDATLAAEVTGGAPPYSYQWSNGSTDSSITVGPGSYDVAVSDTTDGCPPLIDSAEVLQQDTVDTPVPSSNSPVCEGDSIVLDASTISGVSYHWYGPGGFSASSEDTALLDGTLADSGEYFVYAVANGCNSDTNSTLVDVNSVPTAPSAGNNGPLCEGDTLDLTATGISGGDHSWTGPNGFSSAQQNPSILNVSMADSGEFVVDVTVDGCTSESDTTLVDIDPTPNAPTAGGNTPVCVGSDLNLTASSISGANYDWTGPNGFTSSQEDPVITNVAMSDSGWYAVDVTVNGCTGPKDSVLVDVDSGETADAGGDQQFCADEDAIPLNGSTSTGSGSWSSSGTGSFSPTSGSLNADYLPSSGDTSNGSVELYLTSTNNGACGAAEDTVQVEFRSVPVADPGANDTVCANDADLPLTGSVSNASGGTWESSGDGSFSDPNVLSPTYSAGPNDTASGSVTLSLITTGNGVCDPDTNSMTLTITDAPQVNAGTDRSICKTDVSVGLNGDVSGPTNTGNWSTLGTGNFADPSVLTTDYFPSSDDTAAGSVDLVLTSTNNGDCLAETDTMTIGFVEPPVSDAGPDQVVCANADTVSLDGWSSTGAGQWVSSGSGGFEDPSDTNTFYYASDADTSAGSVTLTLITANSGTCTPDSSEMTLSITDAPIADAGVDDTVCANSDTVGLSGSVQVATGGVWSTSGDGSFTNDSSLATSYDAGPNDVMSGSVELYLTTTGNGDCNPVIDTMSLTVTDSPVVDAGSSPIFTCLSDPTTSLDGTSSTGSGQWSTLGSGTFDPSSTALNNDYHPSNADTANGSVQLVLTSTANGNCIPVHDTVEIQFTPIQQVDAGPDTSLCANAADLQLDGEVTSGSPTGQWSSSGSGTFIPNDTALDALYSPGDADTAAGSVWLVLTSTNGCEAVKDSLLFTITDAPKVDAGPDMVRCKDAPDAALDGDVFGATNGGVWSTLGSGSFSPDSTALDADYIPSSADTVNGSVTLVLISTNNGDCLPVSDTMTIDYVEPPVSDAGPDDTACANTLLELNGNVQNGSGTGQWSSPNGTGDFLPNDTALNGDYQFSDTDTASGSVTLVLTSTNNGNCQPHSDTMEVLITPAPTVDAGIDRSVCANDDTVELDGSVSIASGGAWSSAGGGSFLPNDSILDPTYQPDSTDSANGGASLTLTTTGNGDCNPVTDSMDLTITSVPIVDAGGNAYICEGDTTASLNGSISGGSSMGQWSTSGTGSFEPSDTDLNATYQLSDADTAAGGVSIALTSTNNGNCLPETDSMEVIITSAATVSANGDTTLCSDQLDSIQVQGVVNGGSGIGEWNSSGVGTFSPSDTSLDPYYHFDPQDTVGGSLTLSFYSIQSCNTDSDSVFIDFIPAAEADAGGGLTICEGEEATLNGNVVNASGAVWSTSGSGQFLPNDSTLNSTYVPGASDIDSGEVQLKLETYGSGGPCGPGKDSLTLTIGREPDAGFIQDPACVGQDGQFIDSSSVVDDSLISWEYVIGGDTLMGPDTTYTYGASGEIDAILMVHTDKGCSDTVQKELSIDPSPKAAFGEERSCYRGVNFSDSSSISSGSIGSWYWDFGDGDTDTLQNPVHSYEDSGRYIVSLTVTSDPGCRDMRYDTLDIAPGPVADYEPMGGAWTVGERIHFRNSSSGHSNSTWIFGDGSNSTEEEPDHIFEEEGTYEVELVVSDTGQCKDTISYEFLIEPEEGVAPVAVPSAFTPNNDGTNDRLRVLGGPMEEMEFRIFNQWGNRIFMTRDQSKGWDGTIGGEPQPSGTYIYILTGVTVDGKEIEMTGEVNLIR